MKKLCFIAVAILLFLGTILSAKSSEVYKRKQIKPNFFMPETSEVKREKLPAFPALEKGLIKVSEDGVIMKKVYTPPKKAPKRSAKKNICGKKNLSKKVSSNAVELAKYSPSDGLGDDLSKDRNYIAKIRSYENDMNTFAQTKIMPKNLQLEADLKKMNSEMPFKVD
ncbi:MAG: hypothetical protein J6T72_04175 [Alphaproteobacteria bacterium]|nr:hypothetical protein [Alphaproteobacteria bacterium]